MSRASEWAKNVREAEAAARQASSAGPVSFYIKFGLDDQWVFSVDRDGSPRIVSNDARNGRCPDVKDLLLLAGWILETFGEKR